MKIVLRMFWFVDWHGPNVSSNVDNPFVVVFWIQPVAGVSLLDVHQDYWQKGESLLRCTYIIGFDSCGFPGNCRRVRLSLDHVDFGAVWASFFYLYSSDSHMLMTVLGCPRKLVEG